jgi:hypothetical protein
MLRCDREGKLLAPRLLKQGDTITIIKGPFTDFVATSESIAPDRRVYVLMELMGRSYVSKSVRIMCGQYERPGKKTVFTKADYLRMRTNSRQCGRLHANAVFLLWC